MTVERIFIRKSQDAPQVECARVAVVAGSGIEGDRYFGIHAEPGQNITLIEAEEVEAFFLEQGLPCDLSITHRNVVTRGIRLNELVGMEFMIGDVRLRGIELCEPCLALGAALASVDFQVATAVRRFVHRAGLRADVLSDGVITRGAEVRNAR